MSANPKSLEQVMSVLNSEEEQGLKGQLRALIEEYKGEEADRQAILDQLVEEGEYEGTLAYDSALSDNETSAASDLVDLLGKLESLIGADLSKGDQVKVSEDAETSSGGAVFFDGEQTGTVEGGPDVDGDFLVNADNMTQYVSPAFLTKT